jgi:hypothetical protein
MFEVGLLAGEAGSLGGVELAGNLVHPAILRNLKYRTSTM